MPREAAKPRYEDAKLLLELAEMTQTESFRKGRDWWFANLPIEKPIGLEEFEQKFPEGSEGSSHFAVLSGFFETAGVLVKHGLLNEDLFFDRFMVEPFWRGAKLVVHGERQKYDPLIAENFEWLARRTPVWRRRHNAEKRRR